MWESLEFGAAVACATVLATAGVLKLYSAGPRSDAFWACLEIAIAACALVPTGRVVGLAGSLVLGLAFTANGMMRAERPCDASETASRSSRAGLGRHARSPWLCSQRPASLLGLRAGLKPLGGGGRSVPDCLGFCLGSPRSRCQASPRRAPCRRRQATPGPPMSDFFLASYITLWFAVCVLAVVVYALVRQVATLTKRAVAPVEAGGPDFGVQLPVVAGNRLNGAEISLGPEFAGRNVFVFLAEDCVTCASVAPQIERLTDDADDSKVWVLLERLPSASSDLRGRFDASGIVSPTAFEEWHIDQVPYACVVTSEGRLEAKGRVINVGRLRETLGLPQIDDESAEEEQETVTS